MRLALLILAGCGAAEPRNAAELGAALAADPSIGGIGNPFACTTCHATSDDAGGRSFPGRTLADSAFRASYWGGYARTLREAVDACLRYFMVAAPLDPESDDARALYAYLVALSPGGPSEALPLDVVANVSSVPRGDPARGAEVYDAACAACHGAAHTAHGRMAHPTLSGEGIVLPEWTAGYATDFPGVEPALVLVEKVRHGQFFLVGGNMPFFGRVQDGAEDADGFGLSDADLGALIGFLGL